MLKPRNQPRAGDLQCFPSEINDDTWMGLHRFDGVHWRYLYEIRADQCPIVRSELINLTARLTKAYVKKNSLPLGELPSLISNVHQALAETADKPKNPALTRQNVKPAILINKSITPDAIISLENGKSYKALTRHLKTLGLTPKTYREKWGLPSNYPMVAVNYAKRRSELAKELGLGRKASLGTIASQPSPRTRENLA